jgi:hypothetical protein
MKRLITYAKLFERGLFNNRTTLQRAIKNCGFPAPFKLSGTRIAWEKDEVEAWLVSRRPHVGPHPDSEESDAVEPNSGVKSSSDDSKLNNLHRQVIAEAAGFLDASCSELSENAIAALGEGLEALRTILAEISRTAAAD